MSVFRQANHGLENGLFWTRTGLHLSTVTTGNSGYSEKSKKEVSLDLTQFGELPRVKVFSDFHCVTKWSRLGNLWEGVSTRTLLDLADVKTSARYVICHGYDQGWTTNLPLDEFLSDDALLADTHDGMPIDADHGGPVRGMVPKLYAWKSAKWICGIELAVDDKPGYWERGGYHNHGDPWARTTLRVIKPADRLKRRQTVLC